MKDATNNTREQITVLKKKLEELENLFDRTTPAFGETTKVDLKELRHWAIFVHAEIDYGIITTIMHYFYPEGILIREEPLKPLELVRAQFLYTNFIEKLGFSRRLEIFRKLNETYKLNQELFLLINRVNDIRNDFAHPTWDNHKKYVSLRQLHKAYMDLVNGFNAFKDAMKSVENTNILLD